MIINKEGYKKIFCNMMNENENEILEKCENIVKKYDNYWNNNYDKLSKLTKLKYYDDYDYLYDVFYCFYAHSINPINYINKYFKRINYSPISILDFGGGLGFTSLHLKRLFPNSKVTYYNIGKKQIEFAKNLFRKEDVNIKILTKLNDLRIEKFDVILTLEVLEHFKIPADILNFLKDINTKYLIDSNSFNANASGHYIEYTLNNEKYFRKNFRRIFNIYLKNYYYLENFGFNCRPRIWRKN